MRFLLLILAAAAASAQPAAKLTGFPFQSLETLRYSIRLPGGLVLGDAVFVARQAPLGWTFETSVNASLPGFVIKDIYRSEVVGDLCSTELDRKFTHGRKEG